MKTGVKMQTIIDNNTHNIEIVKDKLNKQLLDLEKIQNKTKYYEEDNINNISKYINKNKENINIF